MSRVPCLVPLEGYRVDFLEDVDGRVRGARSEYWKTGRARAWQRCG